MPTSHACRLRVSVPHSRDSGDSVQICLCRTHTMHRLRARRTVPERAHRYARRPSRTGRTVLAERQRLAKLRRIAYRWRPRSMERTSENPSPQISSEGDGGQNCMPAEKGVPCGHPRAASMSAPDSTVRLARMCFSICITWLISSATEPCLNHGTRRSPARESAIRRYRGQRMVPFVCDPGSRKLSR